MSMTLEEAKQLKVGDEIELDKNGQRFRITGIAPQAVANKITLLLETEDGIHTFIDEKRLHLVSRAGTNYKPGTVETQVDPVDQLVSQLRETVEESTQDLTEGGDAAFEGLQENLQEALVETVEEAKAEIPVEEEAPIEEKFVEEPELTKPAKKSSKTKKGK